MEHSRVQCGQRESTMPRGDTTKRVKLWSHCTVDPIELARSGSGRTDNLYLQDTHTYTNDYSSFLSRFSPVSSIQKISKKMVEYWTIAPNVSVAQRSYSVVKRHRSTFDWFFLNTNFWKPDPGFKIHLMVHFLSSWLPSPSSSFGAGDWVPMHFSATGLVVSRVRCPKKSKKWTLNNIRMKWSRTLNSNIKQHRFYLIRWTTFERWAIFAFT